MARHEPDRTRFSGRVQARHWAYWRRNWFTPHQKEFCYLSYRTRDQDLEAWKCCPLWLRKLANKWNSREFAIKHGIEVPELYWSGTDTDRMPLADLPDRYVIRAVAGFSRRAVLVFDHGRNLLDGERCDARRIRDMFRPHAGGFPQRRVLVEEFIPPDEGARSELPRDYKVYVFGTHVAAIQVIERRPEPHVMAFDQDWNPLPPIRKRPNILEVPPARPACLPELLGMARTLGNACGTFIRVDAYVTPHRAVFGELTPTPSEGKGYTSFADEYFGDYWQRLCPDHL
jgi:hypothetical protein